MNHRMISSSLQYFFVAFIAIVLALVMATAADAHSIAAGGSHSCAVTQGGAAQCWGGNEWGQLGGGFSPPSDHRDESTDSTIPVNVVGISGGATAIAAGVGHSCAIVNGAAKCWGDNSWNQLGDGSSVPSDTPVQVVGLTSGVTAIAGGYFNTCAVVFGAVKCWGTNNYGNIFNGGPALPGSSVPVAISGLDSGVTDISVSAWHACATQLGAVKCFGENGWVYNFGDGTQNGSNTPVQTSGLDSGVTSQSSNCAAHNGVGKCWGNYLYGGSSTPSSVPVDIGGLDGGVSVIATGGGRGCAVVNSSARCWGDNREGRLGDGGGIDFHAASVQVTGLTSGVTDVANGGGHSCAMVAGRASCWGANYRGQLGDGTKTNSAIPVLVDVGADPDPIPPIDPPVEPPASDPNPPTCTGLTVVGVRGTTEKQSSHAGFGTMGSKFRSALSTTVGSSFASKMTFTGLKYPAKPKSFNPLENNATKWLDQYKSSMKKGREALRNALNSDRTNSCFVMVGYSQGAHVIGDVLASRRLLNASVPARIVAAVLLADPRFDPGDTAVQRYGSFEKNRGGKFTPRKRGSMIDPTADYKVMSACKKRDFFCQRGGELKFWEAIDVHLDYAGWAKTLGGIVGDYILQEFD